MSKKLNLLALPKEKAFMKCFIAPPGMNLIQGDVSALEPNVLTHFSQDPVLLTVYGKNAWAGHDIYLIAGMSVPGMGDEISAIYDMNNPTKEAVALAKKTFGKERKQLKAGYLGWQYGIGPEKLATGLEISYHEASRILKGFDKRFAGVGRLQERLLKEWARNGGYIIGGRGRPICVDFGSKKDVVNRLVQTTGHDVLTRINWHINNERKRLKVQMRPYVPDWHDEGIWAAMIDETDRAKEVMQYGFDRVNDELGWTVTIRHGGLNHGPDLTLRCED